MTSSATIVVSGPADPGTIRVFRAVAASLASRLDLSVEEIDEWKIAVDEAATMVLRAGRPARLVLTLTPTGAGARADVESDGRPEAWPDGQASGWSMRVLRQLASRTDVDRGEVGPGVTFEMDRRGGP